MKEYIIRNPVVLEFDPTSRDISRTIRRIFLDDIARTLWMGIKQGHIVNQYFDDNCLDAAKYIKKKGIPKTAEELHLAIAITTKEDNFGGYTRDCLEELLPYVQRKKLLGYVVELK